MSYLSGGNGPLTYARKQNTQIVLVGADYGMRGLGRSFRRGDG
jgi:hypothetical protein